MMTDRDLDNLELDENAQRAWRQWRYRFTADGPDVGDKEHKRLKALFAAAREARCKREIEEGAV